MKNKTETPAAVKTQSLVTTDATKEQILYRKLTELGTENAILYNEKMDLKLKLENIKEFVEKMILTITLLRATVGPNPSVLTLISNRKEIIRLLKELFSHDTNKRAILG